MKEPFCTNPKCEHHKWVVDSNKHGGPQSIVKPAPFKPLSSLNEMPNPSYVTIERHKIITQIQGITIHGYLCSTCYEVFKMIKGS
jgi:hypothetical protein